MLSSISGVCWQRLAVVNSVIAFTMLVAGRCACTPSVVTGMCRQMLAPRLPSCWNSCQMRQILESVAQRLQEGAGPVSLLADVRSPLLMLHKGRRSSPGISLAKPLLHVANKRLEQALLVLQVAAQQALLFLRIAAHAPTVKTGTAVDRLRKPAYVAVGGELAISLGLGAGPL